MRYTYFVPPQIRKRELKIQLFLFFALLVFMTSPVLYSFASSGYSSWITNPSADNMYGGLAAEDKVPEMENSEEDAHSHILLNFLIKLPDGITNALQGSSNSDYNFSIDGIILGRLASGTTVNYTGFDFGNNNPWSSIGAVVYRCLRNACLGGMMIVYLVGIGKNVFMTGEKALTSLKEHFATLIFMFVLVYAMPQILDMMIYVRDYILKTIHDGLYSSGIATSTSTSIIEEYRNIAVNEMNLFNVLLYTGAAISTLWYLFSYLKIAMIQAMLFGLFPLIAILSNFNRKLFQDWLWMFIGNILVPFLDFTILLMPVVVDNTVSTNGLLKALLKLCIIMCAIPARNAVLRLVSIHSGLSVGGGFGAIAGLGAAAVSAGRSMVQGARNAKSLANRESDMDTSASGDSSPDMSKEFGEDVRNMESLVDASDQVETSGYGTGDESENTEAAFEKSQDAVDGIVADGTGEDETDLTGQTESEEPAIPDADYESEELGDGVDATGTPAHEELDVPLQDADVVSMEDGSEAVAGGNPELDNVQGPVEMLDVDKEADQAENPSGVASIENGTEHSGSETSTVEAGTSEVTSAVSDAANHGINGESADRDVDQTGTAAKVALPQVESRNDDGYQASMKEYGESENLAKFNDARFKNLENMDAANNRLSGLKSQEARLESDRSSKAALYAEAKDSLNAVSRDTSSAVRDANHNVELASNNLQSAKHEQVAARENVASMANNQSASRAQRAVAEERLQMANQNVAQAQENYNKAKEAQTTAQKNQTERVEQATRSINEHRQALNDATKRVEDNSHAQRVENARLTQAKQYEEKFRNVAQSFGMSNRGYTNADDFKRQRMVDGRMRSLANYKNFNSSNFRNVLSPEERSQFQRERELHAARAKRIEQTRNILTGNVAGAVNGADTMAGKMAVGAAAGGAKAVHTAAQVAAFAGGGIVGSFGGAAGAVAIGGLAAKTAGSGKAVANATANVLQASNQAEPKRVPETSNPEKQHDSVASQKQNTVRPTKRSTGKPSSSRKIITDNAKNAGGDPEINKIIK